MSRAAAVLEARHAQPADRRLELKALRLGKLSPVQRRAFISNLPQYRTADLAQRLLDKAFESRFGEVAEMRALAEAAIDVAEAVTGHPLPTLLCDIKAQAWAVLANVCRISGDVPEARSCFRRAYAFLEDGTGDPMVAAWVGDLYASLLDCTGEQERAADLYRGICRTYLRLGEQDRAARTLVQMSRILGKLERFDDAEHCVTASLGMLDAAAEPSLVISASQILASILGKRGRYEEALDLLRRTSELYDRLDSRVARTRCRWVEAQLASEAGYLPLAEALLFSVREELLAEDRSFDASLASIELALILFRQERHQEAAMLAEQTYAAFTARQLDQRANAALLLWVNAVRSQTLSVEVLSRLASELKAARASDS